MKASIQLWITKGNSLFLAGQINKAMIYYYKAFKQSKALRIVENYIQKNKNNLAENEQLLKQLLSLKYHITLFPGVLPVILKTMQQQMEKKQEKKVYHRFKTTILSKHPKTPEQFVDALIQQYKAVTWEELEFLSRLLLEKGFNYYVCDVDRLWHDRSKVLELTRFEHSLLQKQPITLADIDKMTGHEFEDFLITLFRGEEYKVERNKKRSHEQGLDLLLIQRGEKTAVQVKRYKKSVGNKAIQEVNAARMYYRCHRALVITNSRFTPSAKQLAERCNIELWDRDVLKDKIQRSF